MSGTNGNGSTNGKSVPEHPSLNGANGRDSSGRFTKGNPGGTGNPHAKKVLRLRAKLLDSATDERVDELIDLLWTKALIKQEQWAIQEVLNRLYGKPKETLNVEGGINRGDPEEILNDKGVTDALAALRRRTLGVEVVGPGPDSN